jgi:hypothetical protein
MKNFRYYINLIESAQTSYNCDISITVANRNTMMKSTNINQDVDGIGFVRKSFVPDQLNVNIEDVINNSAHRYGFSLVESGSGFGGLYEMFFHKLDTNIHSLCKSGIDFFDEITKYFNDIEQSMATIGIKNTTQGGIDYFAITDHNDKFLMDINSAKDFVNKKHVNKIGTNKVTGKYAGTTRDDRGNDRLVFLINLDGVEYNVVETQLYQKMDYTYGIEDPEITPNIEDESGYESIIDYIEQNFQLLLKKKFERDLNR